MKMIFLILMLLSFNAFSMERGQKVTQVQNGKEGNDGYIPLSKERLFNELQKYFKARNKTMILCLLFEANNNNLCLWCEDKNKLPILYIYSWLENWLDVFQFLLQKDFCTDKSQLLHSLVANDCFDPRFLELVLKSGANINYVNKQLKTVLDYVVMKKTPLWMVSNNF